MKKTLIFAIITSVIIGSIISGLGLGSFYHGFSATMLVFILDLLIWEYESEHETND